jgi:sirohydrochlorin ferrochelatase
MRIVCLLLLALAACARGPAAHSHVHPAPAAATRDLAFVIAAPDRGFLGNEELADAVAELAAPTRLVHVTDDRTAADLDKAVDELAKVGATKIVVLPLFLSRAEAGFRRLEALVAQDPRLALGNPFGDSYLAVELVADRLRAQKDLAGKRLVIAGYGAADEPSRDAIANDLRRIATAAAAGFQLADIDVVVWLDRDAIPRGSRDTAAANALAAAAGDGDALVVPLELGPRLDSMMTFANEVAGALPRGSAIADGITPDPLVALWLAREANAHTPLRDDDIGVVLLAHGSDHHWNQTMCDAVASLKTRYMIECSFSMADQPLVERAIRKLEQRGARAIVVVRVFGLASSFQGSVERMLGLDLDLDLGHGHELGHGHDLGHGHGHGHDHGLRLGPPPRIRSAARFATTGGLEDSPELADALLDRARALSKNPSRETVVLVAHGSGDDATNDHWKHVLASVADRMRESGPAFRAIEVGTWREDWPDKRAPEVAAIRAIVESAAKNNGRAIVIPARTTGEGAERVFLEGLAFELGTGFAPHARFTAWFERQIRAGIEQLTPPVGRAPERNPPHDHAHH